MGLLKTPKSSTEQCVRNAHMSNCSDLYLQRVEAGEFSGCQTNIDLLILQRAPHAPCLHPASPLPPGNPWQTLPLGTPALAWDQPPP